MNAYLDYNSTTPLDPAVLDAMLPYFKGEFGNASSIHKKGQTARHAVEAARERIADFIGTEPGDIVFTSGGTEADNLAIKGVMIGCAEKRKQLVVSAIEHQAVLGPAELLKKSGFEVTVVPVKKNGIVDLDRLKETITPKTALVSLMHVNNEVGAIQPVKEAGEMAHAQGAFFHCDAVQSFGKLLLDVEKMGVDLLSMSAHKICGPKGAGALYIRKGMKLKAQTHGGHQEKNVRPGTENVAGIVGFGKAVELVETLHTEEAQRVERLRNRLHGGLRQNLSGLHLNGDPDRRLYSTLNLSFEELDGETILMNLDLKNIFTSTGSACTAGSVEPSHVLLAMGLSEKLARAAVRFSLGRFTTDAEIDYVLQELPPIIERLRKTSTSKSRVDG